MAGIPAASRQYTKPDVCLRRSAAVPALVHTLAGVWALVAGCVRSDSGPEAKMRGLAAALTDLGVASRLELIRPDRSAGRRTAALLDALVAHPPPGRGLVLLRSHWSLPTAVPALRRLRALGHRIVIDVPTPVAAGVREIRAAPRRPMAKAGRLLAETAWTPLAWPVVDLLVQYAPDAGPWRHVAADRRLTVTNGVDVSTRPLAAGWVRRTGVTFVCAGAIGPWHGLDRLVRGMAVEPDQRSQLLIVGEGPELPRLRMLTHSLGLTGRVQYTGSAGGGALDALMAGADVGVASLAEHRRGVAGLSPLKTRDYLARGLPVVFAGDDPDLRSDPEFTLRVADDDSPLDVPRVTAWLDQLRKRDQAHPATSTEPITPTGIREFAVQNLQWRSRVEAILTAVDQLSGL